MQVRQLRRTASIVLLLATIAAGCSSDSKTSTSSSSSGAAAPSGPPIKLVMIYDRAPSKGVDDPGFYGGTQAAAAAVNKAGGIKGRPLQIVQCDGNLDVNQGAKCARDAVADPQVVALINSVNSSGAQINPIIEQAGMANFGGLALDATDMTSPNVFDLDFGVTRSVAAALIPVKAVNAKKMAIMYLDFPAAAAILPVMDAVLGQAGVTVTSKVPIPPGAADLSPLVAQAASGNPDAILLLNNDSLNVRVIQAAHQQGIETKFTTGALNDGAIKDLGADAEGVYVAQTFLPASSGGAGNDQVNAELAAYDKNLKNNASSKSGFMAVHLFVDIASKLDTIDRASFLAAVKKTSSIDARGLLGNIDFTKPFAGLGGKLPQMFNPFSIACVIKNGQLTAIDGKFVDTFSPS